MAIFRFQLTPNIMLLKQGEVGLIFAFRFSIFDIRTETDYPILTFTELENPFFIFKILFSNTH